MRSTQLICLVLLLSACVALGWETQSRSSLTAPVFMWSDNEIFQTTQVKDTVSSYDLRATLASLFRVDSDMDSKLIDSLNQNVAAPEVVILFVEKELRTDEIPYLASAFASTPGGSLSNIKKAVESAKSSLVMPYASVDESNWLQTFSFLLDSFSSKANFFMTASETNLFQRMREFNNIKTVALGDLIAEMKVANAFSNGVPDLVVVTFDTDASDHDAMIGEIVNSIRIATNGNYVSAYTAITPSASHFTWNFNSLTTQEFAENVRMVLADDTNTTNASNRTNSTTHHKINYFPGPFIEVLLVSAVLITMLFTGACAIFSLQTPDKWEAPKLKRDQFQ